MSETPLSDDQLQTITEAKARRLLRRQMADWRQEIEDLKLDLINAGSKPDSLEYNLKANEALRLSLCINDLADLLIDKR